MRSVFVKVVGLGSLAIVLLMIRDAANLLSGNLKFTDAETEVSFWGRGNYQPSQKTIERTARSIDSLVEDSGQNPSYLSLSAATSAWLAYWTIDSADRERFVQQSITAQTEATESRPAHRQSWIKLVEYLPNTNKSGETEAWARNRLAGLQINTKNDLRK